MDYKKLIPNKKMRLKILDYTNFIPDKLMIQIQYYIKTGRLPNLTNPKRYSEKLQWYKLYYRDPLMTKCADKYEVRDYIKEKGFKEILTPLYEVYDNVNDIEFDSLPNSFAMKNTSGAGGNIFVKDKNKINYENIKEEAKQWLENTEIKYGREWCYYDIEPQIVIEQLLVDEENPNSAIKDYKFFCFNGKVEYINLHDGRGENHVRNFYDRDWNYLDIGTHNVTQGEDIYIKPEKFDEMIEIVEKLSNDFPAVRVDLYYINQQIYFGELTFYPWTGYVEFEPDEFDYILGEKFELPQEY